MSKTPGRKPNYGSFKKRKLSSDAKIIIALMKKQPQAKADICKQETVNPKTFYRVASFLEEIKIIKRIDGMDALWNFDYLERKIEDALSKISREKKIVFPDTLVNEIGRPLVGDSSPLHMQKPKELGLINEFM